MKTMQEQGYQPPVLIAKANGFADPSFIPATKGISNGLTSVVEWNPDLTKGADVNKRFREIFGVDMNGLLPNPIRPSGLLKPLLNRQGRRKARR